MKGFVDTPFIMVPIAFMILFLFITPPSLDTKIKQIYQGTIEYSTAQDVLLSILSSTNTDSNGKEKTTLEILGSRALFPNQDVSFLKEDLDKIVKRKCYALELESDKLAENDQDCSDSAQTVEVKLVLPYDPSPIKLTKKIKLVIK